MVKIGGALLSKLGRGNFSHKKGKKKAVDQNRVKKFVQNKEAAEKIKQQEKGRADEDVEEFEEGEASALAAAEQQPPFIAKTLCEGSEGNQFFRYSQIQVHRSNIPGYAVDLELEDRPRCCRITNIPLLLDFKEAFAPYGRVETVIPVARTKNAVFVIFKTSAGLRSFIKACKSESAEPLEIPESSALTLCARIHQTAMADSERTIQRKIDKIMEKQDKLEEKRKKKLEKLAAEQDEDGFTVYHSSSNNMNGPKLTTASSSDFIAEHHVSKKPGAAAIVDKEKLLTDFYEFQKKKKGSQLMSALKSGFEQDKAKISQMRDARKFKPY